ncbi:carotenoid 1,2-hydratase [Shewanella sp. WXL01]|uniref:lipocalin-like domain-containing protein n=1 Tax=Shewanella sp. WXL01 TaxID=2709721 RepID=UPI0014386B22|nr:lipocalin-like domain-containing protein [Shewanella sp. WXL01]NKF49297.1 carotenoid 1,2-hydratase [Shewanella sp. WXL01]
MLKSVNNLSATYTALCLSLCLTLSMSACSDNPASTERDMGKIMGNDAVGYTKVVPNKPLVFPQDHQAHNDFKQEWWYLTANLTTESGEPLGLQWTQFRIALTPPAEFQSVKDTQSANQPLARSADWQTNQVYMAHAALTSKDQHFIDEKWSRAHPQLASVQASPLAIFTHNWRWQSQTKDLFPATLTAEQAEFGFTLQLDSTVPFQRQGDNGYSIKYADSSVASYYYSQPYIEVSGTVQRDGKSEKVSGKAWLDREWSSQFLTKSQQGWDWFSLRLTDEQTMMIFRLRGDDPSDHFFSARLMQRDGSGNNLTSKDNPDDITMTPTQWQQTKLGKHPVAWRIQVESQNIDIQTQALNPDSDMALSVAYWEGPISFSGTHQGTGYMELTGYD